MTHTIRHWIALIESLSMDTLPRLQRAAQMGYAIPAYHGTAFQPVQRFEPHSLMKYTERDYFGASFTPSPQEAGHYAQVRGGGTPNVLPVMIKGPLYAMSPDEERDIGSARDAIALRKRLSAEGYTGIWFDNQEIKVWVPSAIRSRFAKFDPEQAESDDLLD